MKKIIFMLIIPAFFMVSAGSQPVSAQSSGGEACYSFESCAPKEVLRTCFETSANGCVDWENGVIYAIGIGVPNPNLATESQKNFSAVRAATVVGQRNLLEIIQGVQITSTTTVEMGMAESDTIVSAVNGSIKRVQPIGRPDFLNDGSVAVTVRYFMKDLANLMLGDGPYSSRNSANSKGSNDPYGSKKSSGQNSGGQNSGGGSSNSSGKDGAYTGLVLDATGHDVVPALSPKVFDSEGGEVYGAERTSREFNISQGIMGYAKSIDKAKSNSRVKGNPLVIKIDGPKSPGNVDMVISEEDGKLLRQLYETQSFLREGRVMVVVD